MHPEHGIVASASCGGAEARAFDSLRVDFALFDYEPLLKEQQARDSENYLHKGSPRAGSSEY